MTVGFFLESLHLIEFSLLYLMVVAALKVYHHFTRTTNLLAAIFACFYGLTDEVHQLYVDGRSFTVNNLIKGWIGVMVSYTVVRIKDKHLAPPQKPTTKNSSDLILKEKMDSTPLDTLKSASALFTHD